MNCKFCKPVNMICFWGPRKEAGWKRPILLVCSLGFALGIGAILWLTTFHATGPELVLVVLPALPFSLLSVAGLVVALAGCDACVARLLGEY